jgi:hypothetical protein
MIYFLLGVSCRTAKPPKVNGLPRLTAERLSLTRAMRIKKATGEYQWLLNF